MFYAVGDLRMFPVLFIAVVINFLFGRALRGGENKFLLAFALFLDAAMLVEFKLLGQFVDNNLMPIGVSFFTFKMISYQMDVYNGKIEDELGFVDVAAYFCMFPQIVSGPIMRFGDYVKNPFLHEDKSNEEDKTVPTDIENKESQEEGLIKTQAVGNDAAVDNIIDHVGNDVEADEIIDLDKEYKGEEGKKSWFSALLTYLEKIEDGARFFILGLGMKVLLADHLAMLWKDIGTIGYESISTPLAWLGAVCYSLELYMDFWGYSLMAAGVGIMLGFPFVVNFDQPYSSKNVSEFYRRWHATLGSWFKDYIYIPMGGSRHGEARTFLNLFVVWLITGFWHGVTLNFILWGMIIFVIIVCERFILTKLPKALETVAGRFNVFVLIPLSWVVFAISDNVMLSDYFKRLFPFFGEGISVNQGDFLKNLQIYGVILGVSLILLIPGLYSYFEKHRKHPVFTGLLLILFWACVYSLSNAAGNPFMYFKF